MSKYRVVVQLTDTDKYIDPEKATHLLRLSSSTSSGSGGVAGAIAKIDLVDDSTVLLSAKNARNMEVLPRNMRQLKFDCIAHSTDPRMRYEFSTLMDQLLINNRRCCILQFVSERECRLSSICQLLVNEVEKRMLQLQGTMHSIKLEYYDVKKYDVVNLLGKAKGRRAKRMKGGHCPQKVFASTVELLKWLQQDFIELWPHGQGHESIDIQYNYSDTESRTYTAKLSLLQFYLDKMDNDTKSVLCTFFQNLNPLKTQVPIKNILITDCIREVFDETTAWHTLVVFDLRLMSTGETVVDDMLKLATTAYLGVKSLRNNHSDSMRVHGSAGTMSFTSKFLRGKTSAESEVMRSMYSSAPSGAAELSHTVGKDNSKDGTQCWNRDFYSISSWYYKVDEEFSRILNVMELFYEHAYEAEIFKICDDVKQLTRSVDQIGQQRTDDRSYDVKKDALIAHHREYKGALLGFRELSKDIERSEHAKLLKMYMQTKGFELQQRVLQCKVRQLQNCQTRLSGAIRDEVNALNAEESKATNARG